MSFEASDALHQGWEWSSHSPSYKQVRALALVWPNYVNKSAHFSGKGSGQLAPVKQREVNREERGVI